MPLQGIPLKMHENRLYFVLNAKVLIKKKLFYFVHPCLEVFTIELGKFNLVVLGERYIGKCNIVSVWRVVVMVGG